MLAGALAWINVVLGLILAVFTMRYLCKSTPVARWVKTLYALIGIYWAGLYFYVAINVPGVVDPVWFGQVFVRPAFTFTLAAMAVGAIYRWRSYDD